MDLPYPNLIFLIFVLVLLKLFVKITLGISKSHTCLVGKTVLITGGNSGIGYETALALAGRGPRIIIADKVDATKTITRIIEETDNENIVYKYLDLSSLASIRQFAKDINESEERLDILINNAGIGGIGHVFTDDGLQMALQVNYYGPFLLTHLLVDLLKKTAPSRIIFVSSFLAHTNNFSLRIMNKTASKTTLIDDIATYSNSKLMLIIASNIFAEKLKSSMVTCNAVHPGLAKTTIFSNVKGFQKLRFWYYVNVVLLFFYGKTAWEAAQTQIECALSKKLKNVTGKFFSDCTIAQQPLKATNKDLSKEVWRRSEDFVHLKEHERL